MTITIGTENEFDVIHPDGRVSRYRHGYDGHCGPFARGWRDGGDASVCYEISSDPYFSSVEEMADAHKRQWALWLANHDGAVPHMCATRPGNYGSNSNHMHVGTSAGLSAAQRHSIVHHSRMIYNYLSALQGNPLPSFRVIEGNYCNSITNYGNEGNTDHYCELSFSHEGTVEHRRFDANIPQVNLANAWLLFGVASHAVYDCIASSACRRQIDADWTPQSYDRERLEAARYGVSGVRVDRALRYITEWMPSLEFPEAVPAVKEVLFMSAKYFSSPATIYATLQLNSYDYYKTMLLDPYHYFEPLKTLTTGANRERILQWERECAEVTNLNQLLELAVNSLDAVRRFRPRIVATGATLYRTQVAENLASERFCISRISEAPMASDRVLQRISELLTSGGDGWTNPMQPRAILEANERFYVMVMANRNNTMREVVGCIAIRMSTGEVAHLVVDRRFRRLGIATRLMEHVKQVARECNLQTLHTHIRNGNQAGVGVFTHSGFSCVSESGNTMRFECNLQVQATQRVDDVDVQIQRVRSLSCPSCGEHMEATDDGLGTVYGLSASSVVCSQNGQYRVYVCRPCGVEVAVFANGESYRFNSQRLNWVFLCRLPDEDERLREIIEHIRSEEA